ncbi:peroxiredoxin family protein [Edaphobacter albus]|uniref:peroxiredoxin family protein n=1 Tax=Edaphobacter sp. 4G125 TaxID=2763071 RepID=UPI00164882CF|nr:TlpA disulfide reductase family protein [Edaphobacter sp. 4G125]QNI38260.1 TlpA family protein disulfide reductase [Edaphobacter sp. 4G125]
MNALTGRLFAVSVLAGFFLASSSAFAASSSIDGIWEGSASVRGQEVPLRLQISGPATDLHAALLNGAEQSVASSAKLQDGKLLLNFNYFARSLEATVAGEQLTGTFGTTSASPKAAPRVPVTLHRASAVSNVSTGPDIHGDWEIAVSSSKGESAWQLRIDPATRDAAPATIRAVIQRIDGDTGSLYGAWDGNQYKVSHFTAAGPALYSIVPRENGTLLVSNLLATETQKVQARDLVARRPAEARKENLAAPTESTEQTRIKDPSAPFTFKFPDVTGKEVSSSDARFRDKVVIVAIGGSWCPNCHDEAPFLESLYKQFHGKGLEVVNLSFEEEDQLQNPTRLRAFIQRYGITYPVLIAGTPDQLTEKITQADHLNCWPTSFILGRDGRVREVHAGFAGPANPPAHQALEHEVTALVEKLLAEPRPVQKASF